MTDLKARLPSVYFRTAARGGEPLTMSKGDVVSKAADDRLVLLARHVKCENVRPEKGYGRQRNMKKDLD